MVSIHIYPSTFVNETRILKVVRSLVKNSIFDKVIVIALWKDGLPKRESLGNGVEVWRIRPLIGHTLEGFTGRIVKVLGWHISVLLALHGQKVNCFNCHSLPVLPLSTVIKFWKRCTLVYEPHELETETVSSRGLTRFLLQRVEQALIRYADAVCVVNRSIAHWYERTYNLRNVSVVQNVPYRSENGVSRTGLLRNAVGLDSNEAQIFLYQGLLAPGRGIEILLEVFSTMPPHKHLVLMGYGELEERIRNAASQNSNIHFLPAVSPELVKNYTADADVGLALIEDVCLSYRLCLPNKLFEYASCGVAIVASDFPEMGKFIEEFECGWKVAPTATALRSLLQTISAEDIIAKRARAASSNQFYGWDKEEKSLLAMYTQLGFATSSHVHA